jgi:hypothetical protein
MTYSNACFISYKRPPDKENPRVAALRNASKHIWLQFVEKFEQLLGDRLNTPLQIFRDIALNADPGKPYPEELSKNLCKSVCMVALLVPEYIESSWCVAEWKAMENLEAKRLGKNQRGLIIPVIFQGGKEDLADLFGTRETIDLRGLQKPSRQLGSLDNLEKIGAIADTINRYVKKFEATHADCDKFTIPIGAEENTPKIVGPSPFRR